MTRKANVARSGRLVYLSGVNLSPSVYGGRPIFVIDGQRYYMASKHTSIENAIKAQKDTLALIGKYLHWYLRLFKVPKRRR